MKFSMILIFVLLIMAGCARSSGKDNVLVFEGVINNMEGKPITSTVLSISSRKVDVDDNGYFCYEGLHSLASLELSIRALGYNSFKHKPESGLLYLDIKMSKINSGTQGSIKVKPLPENIGEDFYCSNK